MPEWLNGAIGMSSGLRQAVKLRLDAEGISLWFIPVGVAAAVSLAPETALARAIGAALAVLLFVFLVNRPGATLIALVIFLPFQTLLFGLLLAWGVPRSIVGPANGLKELMALAILVAGLRQIRDTGRRMDRIDIALLLYVGVVTIYLMVPDLFSSIAPTQWEVRLLAWRNDVGYPLLFFAARHAPIRPQFKNWFMQVILAMGAFVASVGLYQRLDPVAYQNFVLNTAHIPTYFSEILGFTPTAIVQTLVLITNLHPLHVSSVFLSPYDMGDYLVLVVAVASVGISQNYRSAVNYGVLALAIGALFFSRSRSDALAAVIVLVLVALPTSRGPVEGRWRLIATIVLAAALIVPALGGSRFLGHQGGNASSTGHVTEVKNGLTIIRIFPLGLGLGDQPGVSKRFVTSGTFINGGDISDNLITQVGDELGVQALIPWLAMMGIVLLELRRRAGRGDVFAACIGFGLLGVVIAGLFHHVFLTSPGPWTLWGGAGLALSVHQDSVQKDTEQPLRSYPAAPGVP